MIQLQGMISLKDQFSGPLKRATSSMNTFKAQTGTMRTQTNGLSSALGKTAKSGGATAKTFDTLKRSAGGFAGVASSLPGTIAGIGAGMAALGSLNKAMDFESQMSTIKALTGASGDEMKKLTDLAMDLGAKTKYSALEAGKGLEELLKAGITPVQVHAGALESALSLATAGGLELADASEIMSTALNAFKSDGMKAAQVSDILAGAANSSATSVGELKYGLSMVSAVASGMGVSFKDTNAALAVFAQNGLKGSDGGTSLKTMLMNLSPATKAAEGQMMDLGIVTEQGTNAFFTASGNLKSMAEVAGVLKKSLTGLSSEQRTNALRTMFGADAIRAANILFKEGAEGVKLMTAEMGKVSALDVAKEKMNNAAGAMEQFKGAMETMQIALGTALLPAVKELALWMAGLTEKFQQGGAMAGLTEKLKAFGSAVVALKKPLAVAGVVLGLTLAFSGLAAILGVVVSPIGAVVAGVSLVGYAFYEAYKRSETFRNIIGTIGDVVKGMVAQIKAYMASDGAQIFDALKNAGQLLSTAFQAIFPVIKWLVIGTFDAIKNVIQGALTFIMGAVKVFTGVFTGDFGKMWEGVKQMFTGAIQFIWGYVNLMFVGRILKAGKALFMGLKGAASAGWATVSTFFKTGITKSGNFVSSGMAKIKSFFSGGVSALKTKAAEALNNVKTTFSTKFSEIKGNVSDWASQLPSTLYGAFKGAIGALSGLGSLVWEQIKGSLPSMSTITSYIGGLGGGGSKKSSGGHAKSRYSGTYNVPRHGYMAKLHSGESVLTASQSAALRSAGILQRSNGNLATVNPNAGAVAVPMGGGRQAPSIHINTINVSNGDDYDTFTKRLITDLERAHRG